MIDYALTFAGGFGSASWIGYRIWLRMCRRIVRNQDSENYAKWLENRREATDSGRFVEDAPGAGSADNERSLFDIRPGAMYLNKLKDNLPENRSKVFDTGHFSTTLDQVSPDQQS